MAKVVSELFYTEKDAALDFQRRGNCQFATYSACSPTKLTANEDCAGWIRLDRHHWVFIVADGLGGLPAGDTASQIAVQSILDHLEGIDVTDTTSSILAAIDAANKAVLDSASGGATTIAIIEMNRETVRSFHIGDSTIMVTGQRGAIKFNSVSHSPTGYMEEAGLLTEQQAMLHRERNLVSNVVGSNEMRIDIGPTITLAKYDTVVLASDGLCDNLYQAEVVDQIRKGPLDKGTLQLADLCQKTMLSGSSTSPNHPDDLTILTLRRNL